MPAGMFGGPDEIVPGVFLGGFLALDACQRKGIEYVLSIVDNNSYEQIKEEILDSLLAKDVKLDLYHIDLEDKPSANLLEWLDVATAHIEKVLQADGKVLIHCMAGVSRSATCVAAHIVKTQGMSPHDTIKMMKEKRECVNPNTGFMKQLLAWHAMGNKVDKEHPEYLKLFPLNPTPPNSNGKSQFDFEREVPIVSLPDHNSKNINKQAAVEASDSQPPPAEPEVVSTSSVTAVTESMTDPPAAESAHPKQPSEPAAVADTPKPAARLEPQKPAGPLGCFFCFK